MSGLAIVTIVGVIVVAALVAIFLKMRQSDLLGALLDKRRASSQIVSRAEFVEGAERMPVALALSGQTIFYENPDLEASFDVARIDEIEYDDELSTSKTFPDHFGVLRLRSHGTAFEFLLEKPEIAKWKAALPERRMGPRPAAHAV